MVLSTEALQEKSEFDDIKVFYIPHGKTAKSEVKRQKANPGEIFAAYITDNSRHLPSIKSYNRSI